MGISAVIDGNGRVLRPQRHGDLWEVSPDAGELPVSEWEDYKKVSGVLLATLPLDRRQSFYAQYGDWLPWTCWLLLGVCVAGTTWRRIRRRQRAP